MADATPSLQRLFRYAWKHRWSYLLGTVCLFLTNYMAVTIPVQLGLVIDALNGDGDAHGPVYAILAMGFGVIVVRALSRVLFFNPGRDVEYHIRVDLFRKLMRLQPSFYTTMRTGDIVSRASSDVQYVRALVGFAMLQTVNLSVSLPLTGWRMLGISPKLTGMVVVPIVIGLIVMQVGVRQLAILTRQVQAQLGSISDHVLGSFQGISTIQGFVAEKAFVDRFDGKVDDWFSTSMKLALVRAVFFPFLAMAGGVATWVLVYFGGQMAMAGTISVGDIAAFVTLLGALLLRSIGWMIMVWERGKVAWDRILEILDAAEDRPDRGVVLDGADGPEIRMQGLSFAYPDRPDELVLKNVDVTVPAGSTLGIYGRTGSGKTTLLRVLARMYNPQPGMVTVGGHDVRDLDLDAWRGIMTLVPQRPFLFSETLAQNIALEDQPDGDTVDRAVSLAALAPDIKALEDGLETVVGERGIMLSGGQRQRTTLARGLVDPGRVLLLDDVLSVVDHATEAQLVSTLSTVGTGGARPTIAIVSQRLSALRHADHIIVLEDGAITAQGTHTQLIEQPGIYQDTWRTQQEEQSA